MPEQHHHRGKTSEGRFDFNIVLDALAIARGQTVLDAGCGAGYMTHHFARYVGPSGQVYGLDPDAPAIEVLRAETAGMENVEVFAGDITEQTPLEAGSIDLIYLSTVFHGFAKDSIAGFVTEVRRLLAPGGKLAVLEIKKGDTPFGPPMDIRFSPEELQAAIGLPAAGTVEVGPYFYMQLFVKDAYESDHQDRR